MKKIIRWVIFFLVIGLLYGAYLLFGARVTGAFTLRAAGQAREAGDVGRAAGLYERVLESSPRDETLRLLVCDLYREAGNFSRAEYTLLSGLSAVGPSAGLYRKLCALYVEQDKLFDAVELLDGIRNPDMRDKLNAERPGPPEFLLPGGVYEERVEVGLAAGDGCSIYVSWTGGIPSVLSGLYTGPASPDPGTTAARAVAVSPGGLVSGWADEVYTLQNIIDPVAFADPALERVIRAAAARPEGLLYTSDLWDITELVSETEADYKTLDDLRGLPRLQTLHLTGNHGHCDISALPELEELAVLSLTLFGIDSFDLEIIGQCGSLEELALPGNSIGSVRALEALERLTDLNLSDNSILDVAPLGRLTSLTRLTLSQNAVQDVMALSGLGNLKELRVDQNRLTSLIGLEGLSRLEVLNVSYNAALSSVNQIVWLSSLTRFAASHCQVEMLPKDETKDLSNLKALEELYLAGNGISGLDGIAGLASLRVLDLFDNAVGSLEPLSGCAALEDLNVARNMVSSIAPLAGLPALKTVNVEYNSIQTIQPLKECPALRIIYAFGNPLTDPLGAFDGTPLEGNVFR